MTFEEWFDKQWFAICGTGKNVRESQSELCYQIKPGQLVEFAKKVWEAGYEQGQADGEEDYSQLIGDEL